MNYVLDARPGHYKYTGTSVDLSPFLPNLKLDSGGPFYRFVLTYLVASAGLTPVYDSKNFPDFMKTTGGEFPGLVGESAKFDLRSAVERARDGQTLVQREAEVALCCMLANTAYESIPQNVANDLKKDPVFAVFLNVRNAASHGNRWYFFDKFPKHHGKWRTFEIDHTKKGDANPLQGQPCIYGSFGPADLLYLLQDIEKILPPEA